MFVCVCVWRERARGGGERKWREGEGVEDREIETDRELRECNKFKHLFYVPLFALRCFLLDCLHCPIPCSRAPFFFFFFSLLIDPCVRLLPLVSFSLFFSLLGYLIKS